MLRLPLHHWHLTQGARMTELDGWQIPASYPAAQRAPAALALADLSAFAKLSLLGPGVPGLAATLHGAPSKPLTVATLHGNILACRLADDHLLLLADASRLEIRLANVDLRLSALDLDCQVPHEKVIAANATSMYAAFALIGTPLEEMLHHLITLDVQASLPPSSCAQTNLAGVNALLVRAPDLGLPSLRIFVASDLGEYVWESLLEAGRAWKVAPVGLEEWRPLRKK